MNREFIDEIFSEKPIILEARGSNLNTETGFIFRRVYGQTENFIFHTHKFYEVFLTISGNIIHCVNNEIQILEPGCLVFMRPDDIHRYIYKKERNFAFINLAFSREIADGMFAFLNGATDISEFLNSPLPTVVRLTQREMQTLLKKADLFNTVDNDDIITQKLNVRIFLMDIFIKYFIGRKNETRNDMPVWLEETCDRMKKPENFIAGIKRMVEISGKTQEHLARTLKKYCHVSLSQFVNELRLNYAVNLIVNTNLKITDICYEAGFGNISSFYTLFHETYNTSPKKFRKNQR